MICIVTHPCNPSSWEVEAGGSEMEGQSLLYSESKNILVYMKHCLKKMKNYGTNKSFIFMWQIQLMPYSKTLDFYF